ncbi:hypothetical protein HYDPIDRAFT_34805 [Hydnomerulius pinastri MD-312]|uniref:Unplaced genomic scaffold scaffold_292, whole genome shotgun sequence n=1 Tax=Hydnomerulius pinastri MD-312 TaxID=994086 RepID=A0A0C9W6I5_9AGAM|nr:hypothetical protein HYDPIDRAFT_34805 [Hydnomerulius pinastri MD-312]
MFSVVNSRAINSSFDPTNKAPALHPSHRSVPQPQGVDPTLLTILTSALLVQQLTNSGLLSGTPTTVPSTAAHATTPTTPTCKGVILDQPGSSPPIPTPTTLGRFLCHAEDKLGVVNATSYEWALQSEGIGPDILSDVDDQTLRGKGLKQGDIICLKKGSFTWWSGPNAKRPSKVSYEKRFKEGGGCHFSGPPMKVDEDGNGWSPNSDYDLWYFCEARKEWVQVPPGYIVDEEGNDNPFAN